MVLYVKSLQSDLYIMSGVRTVSECLPGFIVTNTMIAGRNIRTKSCIPGLKTFSQQLTVVRCR